MSLSFVLLVGAGLLIQSLQALRNASPGFTTEGVVTTVHRSVYGGLRHPAREDFSGRARRSCAGTRRRGVGGAPRGRRRSAIGAILRRRSPSTATTRRADQQPTSDYNEVAPGTSPRSAFRSVAGRDFTRADDDTRGAGRRSSTTRWPPSSGAGRSDRPAASRSRDAGPRSSACRRRQSIETCSRRQSRSSMSPCVRTSRP